MAGFFDTIGNAFDSTVTFFDKVSAPVLNVLDYQLQSKLADAQRDALRSQNEFYSSQAALINQQVVANAPTTSPVSRAPDKFFNMPNDEFAGKPATNKTTPQTSTVVVQADPGKSGGFLGGVNIKNIGLILLAVGGFLIAKKKGYI